MQTGLISRETPPPPYDAEVCALLEECVRRGSGRWGPNRVGICDEEAHVYRWVELRRVELTDLLVLLAESGFSILPPRQNLHDWTYDALVLR
ncbi:MAG TPA: hypothetical protein VJM11_00045 [Nevskiaceae bacterium]|nr:hypothetical protein [Nevskiaceae bacterium]